jgi:hypothetical protein
VRSGRPLTAVDLHTGHRIALTPNNTGIVAVVTRKNQAVGAISDATHAKVHVDFQAIWGGLENHLVTATAAQAVRIGNATISNSLRVGYEGGFVRARSKLAITKPGSSIIRTQ